MASPNAGGYECEFVDPVKEFECPLCLHVTRDPHLTGCCGQHFCQTCIDQILADQQPCPFCKSPNFSVMLDKKQNRKVHELKVYCTRKEEGCSWSGELENLDSHSDTDSGHCQYIKVKCTRCSEQLLKCHLQEHVESCPNRPFSCEHCGFEATYKEILEKHQPECADYPTPCPYRCGIGKAIRKCDLEQHLMEEHFTHMSVQLAKKDEQIAEQQGTIAKFKEVGMACLNLLEEKDKQVQQMQSFLNTARLVHTRLQSAAGIDNDSKLAPLEFTTTFSSNLLDRNSRGSHNPSVYGATFYTHPFGCKLMIRFDCFCSCRRDAIMHVISCQGVYDGLQEWPVTCTIKAQLLAYAGQVKEHNNWEVKLSLNRSSGSCLTACNRGLEIQRYQFSYTDNGDRYLRVRIDVE